MKKIRRTSVFRGNFGLLQAGFPFSLTIWSKTEKERDLLMVNKDDSEYTVFLNENQIEKLYSKTSK